MAASAAVQASAPVDGAAATALAQRSACMACHAVDRRMVGPSYRDIATKYRGMDVAKLAASIRAGGSGKWGPVPMPAQPNLSEDNARILAAWVLAGAPAR
ncbi:c-type cytochrome [Serpentinimonas barnesii]|uniref:c-type cytochrome n=1 Tax=Serpentinimonas barnesii TaxID=1458427 RepID=UPI000497C791|nr:c-type cytochrome [Serpentinimonas barnesii]